MQIRLFLAQLLFSLVDLFANLLSLEQMIRTSPAWMLVVVGIGFLSTLAVLSHCATKVWHHYRQPAKHARARTGADWA